jgi:hypothetical protein
MRVRIGLAAAVLLARRRAPLVLFVPIAGFGQVTAPGPDVLIYRARGAR